jgi:hypothetical protein
MPIRLSKKRRSKPEDTLGGYIKIENVVNRRRPTISVRPDQTEAQGGHDE